MSNRHFRFSFSKKLFWLFIWKKKRNWKTWEFKSGCTSDEDKEKNIGLFDFVRILHRSEFYSQTNGGNTAIGGIL